MRESSRIESLGYGTIYLTGCIVAAFLSFSQSPPLQRLLAQAACSWGYVVYYVLQTR
jgi:hypothetical protein